MVSGDMRITRVLMGVQGSKHLNYLFLMGLFFHVGIVNALSGLIKHLTRDLSGKAS